MSSRSRARRGSSTSPGQLGVDKSGTFAGGPGDFEAQTVQAFENLKAALDRRRRGLRASRQDQQLPGGHRAQHSHFREVRDRYLAASALPASTAIGVPALARPGALFEIEAVAILPSG